MTRGTCAGSAIKTCAGRRNAPSLEAYRDPPDAVRVQPGHKGRITVNNETFARPAPSRPAWPPARTPTSSTATSATSRCTSPTVVVNRGGSAAVTVAGKDAVAFDQGDLVS
jgi:hypothetical protein